MADPRWVGGEPATSGSRRTGPVIPRLGASPVPNGRAGATSDLAPAWHTAALVALITSVATTGAILSRGGSITLPAAPGSSGAARLILPICVQVGLVIFVARIGRPRWALGSLLGAGWSGLRRAAGDLAIATGCWVAIAAAELAHTIAGGGAARPTAAHALLPGTPAERALWVAFALTAAVSEEVVYRGYLTRQLAAWSGRIAAGVLLQALLFGAAHLDQGVGFACRAAAYGLGLGLVAVGRCSLIPGILCHAALDLGAGLVGS